MSNHVSVLARICSVTVWHCFIQTNRYVLLLSLSVFMCMCVSFMLFQILESAAMLDLTFGLVPKLLRYGDQKASVILGAFVKSKAIASCSISPLALCPSLSPNLSRPQSSVSFTAFLSLALVPYCCPFVSQVHFLFLYESACLLTPRMMYISYKDLRQVPVTWSLYQLFSAESS